jgi:hypothetical protein
MNFKKQAEKLERFLDDEFKAKVPIIVLPDKSLVYKRFKIKQNKLGMWDLNHITGDTIDSFRLKVTAALAAKFYNNNRFDYYNRIKNLDTEYWTNSLDSVTFKQRYTNSKELDKRDIYIARWQLTNSRSQLYKQSIINMFKHNFG